MPEQGLVTSVGSRSVEVHLEGRGAVRCTLRGNLWAAEREEASPVAAGDRVLVTLEGAQGVVESIAPRDNQLTRPAPVSKGRAASRRHPGRTQPAQVVAANLDRLVVVASLADPPFRAGLVDRFLVAAAMEGIDGAVCLNKVDLEGGTDAAGEPVPTREVLAPWREAGYPVLATSTISGEGLTELASLLARGISLLVGHSGTGKSSLINAISPGLQLRTGDVAGYHGRGRHTTTRVSLLPLQCGGWVVDSPGIREFGLERVPPPELARLFPGFGGLPDACRYRNCSHRDEPRCAVRDAAQAGSFPRERYDGYLRLLAEVEGEG